MEPNMVVNWIHWLAAPMVPAENILWQDLLLFLQHKGLSSVMVNMSECNLG